MSGIQVTKNESGWTITKDGKSYSVVDKNKNNTWDDNEVCKALSGNNNFLTAEETIEAKYQILQTGDGATPAEMAKFEQFQKEKEIRDQKLQQQQKYEQQRQTPKKMNFWQKFANISTAILPMLGGLSGMFMGMGMGSWAYNSGNCNDTALRIMGGTTGAMFGMSSMLSSLAMMNGTNTLPAVNTGYSGGYASGLSSTLPSVIEAQKEWQDSQFQKIQETAEKLKEEKTKKEAENKKAEEKKIIASTIASAKDDDPNKEYLDSLEDIDGEREYTEEEVKNVAKIKKAPQIPVNHIGDDGSDKNKLSPQFAQLLSKKIQEYKKLDEENSDNKFKIFTREQYNEIKTILNKNTLTEIDVKKLTEIYKASKSNNE